MTSSILPRRRGNFLLKILVFAAFLWIVLIFGFHQDPESAVGEHLDRHRLDEVRFSKITRKHTTTRAPPQKVHQKEGKKEKAKPQPVVIVQKPLKAESTTTTLKKIKKPSNVKQRKTKIVKQGSVTKKTAKHILNILAKGTAKKDDLKKTSKVEREKISKIKRKTRKHSKQTAKISKTQRNGLKPKLDRKIISNNVTAATTTLSVKYKKFERPPSIFNTTDLGEMGKAVVMPEVIPAHIKKIYDEGWKRNEFNQYVSDLISFHRKLPDFRTDWCKREVKNYSKKLSPTSVIIIFYNEAWSTLLRSVHSVIDRSPENLIQEIILVDDFSTLGEI